MNKMNTGVIALIYAILKGIKTLVGTLSPCKPDFKTVSLNCGVSPGIVARWDGRVLVKIAFPTSNVSNIYPGLPMNIPVSPTAPPMVLKKFLAPVTTARSSWLTAHCAATSAMISLGRKDACTHAKGVLLVCVTAPMLSPCRMRKPMSFSFDVCSSSVLCRPVATVQKKNPTQICGTLRPVRYVICPAIVLERTSTRIIGRM
jgi:hypothetical protein